MERIDRVVWAVFVAAVVVTGGVVGAIVADSSEDPGQTRTQTRAPESCRAVVDRGVLPRWARTGFSDPRPRMPHVVGREGQLAAILFGPIEASGLSLMIAAILTLGGIVLAGSNGTTAQQTADKLARAEQQRAALIGTMQLTLVPEPSRLVH